MNTDKNKGIPRTTQFLNVDLDIYSASDLQPLVTAMGKKVVVLHAGLDKRTFCAHLELARVSRSADSTIRGFCSLIQALPKTARNLWNSARVRDFNIGVQAGTRPFSHEIALAAETVKAASEAGARIVFTIYAPEKLRQRVPDASLDSHTRTAS